MNKIIVTIFLRNGYQNIHSNQTVEKIPIHLAVLHFANWLSCEKSDDQRFVTRRRNNKMNLAHFLFWVGKTKTFCSFAIKGQIKPKADLPDEDSPKKNERICFVCFFAFHSKQNKFVHSFLGESMERPNCFKFYLTFSSKPQNARDIANIPKQNT